MPQTGPKRTSLQKQMDIVETARLERLGLTNYEIGLRLGVSETQIENDIKKIRELYRERLHLDREYFIGQKLAQYEEILREAMDAWQSSKKRSAYVGKGKNKKKVTVLTTPNVDFLDIMLKVHKATRELLGLDEPQRSQIEQTTTTINWDTLIVSQQINNGIQQDSVEEKIRAVLDKKNNKNGGLPQLAEKKSNSTDEVNTTTEVIKFTPDDMYLSLPEDDNGVNQDL